MIILFFGPLPWSNIQETGFRKTSGGMLKAFWNRLEVEHIWYVQHDRRWGLRVTKIDIDEKLTIIGLPIGLPFERLNYIRWINRNLQSWLLKKFVQNNKKAKNLVYWFYDWWNIELTSLLPQATMVMEITDNVSIFIPNEGTQQKRLSKIKNTALELVDLLIPVSIPLAAECQGARGKVFVHPNAIGRNFLNKARTTQPEPDELKKIAHPRLCVISTNWPLNHRVDHDLLLMALEDLPDWHLVLIGCEKVENPKLKRLIQHSRVTTLGMIALDYLPAFIQACDICTVPYIKSSENSGDRLKIYEYLACRKHVVMTVQEGIEAVTPYLHFAFDPHSFAQTCEKLLGKPFQNTADLDILLDNMTWDQRAENLLATLKELNNEV